MARRKPLKIDDLVHEKSGITVPIYLNTEGNRFMATLPDGKEIWSKMRDDLEIQIEAWLDENTVLEWLPVIQVDEHSLGYGDSTNLIGFSITRMYYAKKKSGTGMMYKHWEPEEDGKERAWDAKWGFEAKDFNPPCSWGSMRGSRDFYLPYSEETWEELQKLQGALSDLKKLLRHQLGTGESLGRLRNSLLAAILPQIEEMPSGRSEFEI